jgi:hypothetical protein
MSAQQYDMQFFPIRMLDGPEGFEPTNCCSRGACDDHCAMRPMSAEFRHFTLFSSKLERKRHVDAAAENSLPSQLLFYLFLQSLYQWLASQQH